MPAKDQASTEVKVDEVDEDEKGAGVKVLSKKEKERLKKEREKVRGFWVASGNSFKSRHNFRKRRRLKQLLKRPLKEKMSPLLPSLQHLRRNCQKLMVMMTMWMKQFAVKQIQRRRRRRRPNRTRSRRQPR